MTRGLLNKYMERHIFVRNRLQLPHLEHKLMINCREVYSEVRVNEIWLII